MNVLVVGAGAVGSVVATAVARAGDDVTLLLRPAQVPEGGALKITIDDPSGESLWAIIPTIAAITDTPDLVILCVKSPDLFDAARCVAPLSGSAPVLTLHSAPLVDDQLTEIIGADRFLSGYFSGAVEYHTPGHALATNSGLVVGNTITRFPAVQELLQRALPLTVVADLAAYRWALLLVNLPQALAAITDTPLASLTEEKSAQHLTTVLLVEATRVLAKAELVPADLASIEMGKLRKLHAMLGMFQAGFVRQQTALFTRYQTIPDPLRQSLRRHRPTEIADLHGALVRLGTQHAIPTPAHARLITVVESVASTGSFLAPDKLKSAFNHL